MWNPSFSNDCAFPAGAWSCTASHRESRAEHQGESLPTRWVLTATCFVLHALSERSVCQGQPHVGADSVSQARGPRIPGDLDGMRSGGAPGSATVPPVRMALGVAGWGLERCVDSSGPSMWRARSAGGGRMTGASVSSLNGRELLCVWRPVWTGTTTVRDRRGPCPCRGGRRRRPRAPCLKGHSTHSVGTHRRRVGLGSDGGGSGEERDCEREEGQLTHSAAGFGRRQDMKMPQGREGAPASCSDGSCGT